MVWVHYPVSSKPSRSSKGQWFIWKPDQLKQALTSLTFSSKLRCNAKVFFNWSSHCAKLPHWRTSLYFPKRTFPLRTRGSPDTLLIWITAITWWRSTNQNWTWTILDSLIKSIELAGRKSPKSLLVTNSKCSYYSRWNLRCLHAKQMTILNSRQ